MYESKTEVKFNSLAMQEVVRPSSAEHRPSSNSEHMKKAQRKRTFKVNF